jgi:Flp pilus assembly protein TadG
MVEFAAVATAFLTMTFGTMEFGRAYYTYETLYSAVRVASRYAIVHGATSGSPATSSDLTTQVENAAPGLNDAELNVTSTWTPDNKPGSTVKVQASYTFDFAGGLKLWNTGPIKLQASSQMVVLQ